MKTTTVTTIAIVAVAVLGTAAIIVLAGNLRSEPVTQAVPTASDSLQGIEWRWTSVTNHTTGQTDIVPTPESYTIVLHEDGTLTGKADCNQFSGSYSQDNGLIITLGTTTLAYCGEESLDQQYLQLLGSIVAGGPDGEGNLALENAGGEQRMIFANGGPAK